MKKTATSLFILLFGASTFAQIPTDNLLCHLKFANNLTDETATATSSIVGNAAAIGYTSDRFGNPNAALTIDNTLDGHVDLGDLNLVDPDYTLSFWMNFSSFTSNQRKVISKREACTGGSLIDVTLYSNPNTLVLESYAQGSPVANISDPTVLTPSTWVHVVFVADQANTETRYYVNGTLIGVTDWGTGLVDGTMDNTSGIALGYSPCVNGTGVQRYNGSLDDLRIYTRSLTDTEVMALYNEADPFAAIEEITQEQMISVFPNPANQQISISITEKESVQIMDLTGAILMESEASLYHQMDISTLAKGIYIVQTSSGKLTRFIKE